MPVKYTLVLFLVLVILFPLFTNLDALPIQQWDESRYATNALEMYYGHHWLINLYDGHPDMWATKPPLMIWLQVLSMWLLGVNELAVRLPSALAAAGTCLLIYYFFTKKYNQPWLGLITSVVLITSGGYVTQHAARSGDLDSVFAMFTTTYLLAYFLYLEEGRRKYLYSAFLFLILASLTKGIQAAVFLPSLVVLTIFRKKLLYLLAQKDFYIGSIITISVVFGYYLFREHVNPGYMAAVWKTEVAGRYTTVIDGHHAGFWYYCGLLVNNYFKYWYLLIVPGILVGFFNKNQWIRNISVYAFGVAAGYLVVISGAQTKLDWYLVPIYPFLSILVAIFLCNVCSILLNVANRKLSTTFNPMPYIFLFLIFAIPYKESVSRALARPYDPYTPQDAKDMEQFLKDVLHHDHKADSCAILDVGAEMNRIWYYKAFDRLHIPLWRIYKSQIDSNGKLIVFRPDLRKYVEDNYNVQILEINANVVTYRLHGKKIPPSDSVGTINGHESDLTGR